MSEWTEKWKATHANYVKGQKDVKAVQEHRFVEGGEIYCVALEGGGFEVRHYLDGKLKKGTKFAKHGDAILAYRALRDELVPNRKAKVTAKEAPKPTKAKVAKTSAKTKTPAKGKGAAKKK